MTWVWRAAIYGLLLPVAISAQTPQQAESLWKARDFVSANDVFRALVAQHPENPEYRVRWGRMFLDHGEQSDLQNAADLFNEALGIKKDDAGAVLGLAIIAAQQYDGNAEKMARQALEWDPKLTEAQELLASLALEDNNNSKAAAEAQKALAMDPHSEVAKGILAAIDWLADKPDPARDPHSAKGYETIAHFFVLNRRYEEAIQFFRKALALDPKLWSSHSELGINLMRLSQSKEAYDELALAFRNGFHSSATKNSLDLMDKYGNFVEFNKGLTVLKMDKKEAGLLRPYFQAEIDRAIATYEKKYKLQLNQVVTVEVYPNHEDFAVRTMGLPGLGALGVTFTSKNFGSSIAMDSPSGRKPGDFHWASTLWHEMSHVFTLNLTDSRVPRWFTEGIAVHEETAASPEWGDRLNPDVLMAIKEKQLLPIAELDRGFIHPQTPTQVIVSYYQAGRICDYITDKFGWDTILAMLRDFATPTDTAAVIRKELKMEPAEFDKQFLAVVENETRRPVENFSKWKDDVKAISEASRNKDYDTVIKLGTAARDLYPDYVEAGSIYEFLANAYLAKQDKPAAVAELDRYVKIGGRNPETLKLLARQLEDAGNKKEAVAVLERLNFIFPMDDDLHKKLGALCFDLGNGGAAVREFAAVVDHHPADPAQAHFDLARAYHLNRQDEKAKDELLASLEAAPGFRAAQKLLLELSGPETENPATPVKK